MNKPDFQDLLLQTHKRMLTLTASKGEEYARNEDQLANFKRNAAQVNLSPEIVWFVYFNKHLDAIVNWINGGSSSEPIEGRIDDAILYLCLLKAMVQENSGTKP